MYKFQELTQENEAANDEWWKTLLVGLAKILTSYADHLSQEKKYLESSEYYQASTKIEEEYHVIQGQQTVRINARLFEKIASYINSTHENNLTANSCILLKYFVDVLEGLKKDVPTEWNKFNNAEKVKSTAHRLLNAARKKIDQSSVIPNQITYSKDRLFPISPKSSTDKIDTSNDVPR